jgi:hypothetical protein
VAFIFGIFKTKKSFGHSIKEQNYYFNMKDMTKKNKFEKSNKRIFAKNKIFLCYTLCSVSHFLLTCQLTISLGKLCFWGGSFKRIAMKFWFAKCLIKNYFSCGQDQNKRRQQFFFNIYLVMQKTSLKIFFISFIRLNVWARNLLSEIVQLHFWNYTSSNQFFAICWNSVNTCSVKINVV